MGPHQKHHCPGRAGNCRMTEGIYQTYCRVHQSECPIHPKVLVSINDVSYPACKIKSEMDAKREREAEKANANSSAEASKGHSDGKRQKRNKNRAWDSYAQVL